MVPQEITLPGEHVTAVFTLPLVVDADPVRVIAPSLDEVKGQLGVGSAELVRQYCAIWTRFLAQAASRTRQEER